MDSNSIYEVHVGNIGRVYHGTDEEKAREHFREYVSQSAGSFGRASGEGVVLMKDGEIIEEHDGWYDGDEDGDEWLDDDEEED